MATYAIGDIQGCYDPLRALLDRLHFNPAHDDLWFTGDLVNRGPQSLAVLRFVKNLGARAVCVLGNHDLYLLAVAAGNLRHPLDPSLEPVLRAPDREELLHWLRHRPLLHHAPQKRFTLIHAGLPPQWDLAQAQACAMEVETVLRGDAYLNLLQHLYGNQPVRWSPNLSGLERLRFNINCFTRLRYCYADGSLDFKEKGTPGSQSAGLLPWFELTDRASAGERIICGHWSTLGFMCRHQVWALDTGCLWGGRLTALRVRRSKALTALHWHCPGVLRPYRRD